MNVEFGAYYHDSFHERNGVWTFYGESREEALESIKELEPPSQFEAGNFDDSNDSWLKNLRWKPCIIVDGEAFVPLSALR